MVEQSLTDIGTAAVLHVRHHGAIVCDTALGVASPKGEAVNPDAIFDLASLTKLFVGTAVLALHDARRVALGDHLAAIIPEFEGQDRRRSQVTYRQLLAHTSGLPAHVNFRDELGLTAVIARVCGTPLVAKPGAQVTYSDLGFMLVGEAVSRITGLPLERALAELVLQPLRLHDVGYRPGPDVLARTVCTENDPWRKRLLRGEVHDENCWAMGGVAGHAGLFGTAAGVADLAELYREGGALGGTRLLLRPTANAATREQAAGPQERRGLAWALRAGDRGSSGSRLSANSFGHTGYTGTSVWVDPKRALTIVLLTNRVYRSRDPEPIRALRAAVADAVVEDLG